MTVYQWLTLGLGAAGFLITWAGTWYRIGAIVPQVKAEIKQDIEAERAKIIEKIETLEIKFADEQRIQDHNFGEVGAAMRQYIADVEKKVREVEIWGRDHYLKIDDFERAIDKLSAEFRNAVGEIKEDIRRLLSPKQ